jgi:hypothetical protein
VSAHRRLISNTSSGSLSEMAPMILLIDIPNRYLAKISQKMVYLQAFRSFHLHVDMAA